MFWWINIPAHNWSKSFNFQLYGCLGVILFSWNLQINCHTVTAAASICGGRCAVAHWSMREDVVVRRHLAKYYGLPPPPWLRQPKTTAARTRLVHDQWLERTIHFHECFGRYIYTPTTEISPFSQGCQIPGVACCICSCLELYTVNSEFWVPRIIWLELVAILTTS